MNNMKYLNKKNKADEDILGDYELLCFIEKLAEKYNLRTTNYQGYFVSEIVKEEEWAEATLSRYTSDEAPIREIEDTCLFNDFDFYAPHVYGKEVLELKTEFRKFMISKFGKEYEEDLKIYLIKQRDEEIKEVVQEIKEGYELEWQLLSEESLEK